MTTRNRKYEDLTGYKYGKLTVLSFYDYEIMTNENRTIRWKCKCDCGNETVVRGTSLRSGHSTSCGCTRYIKKDMHPRVKDMTGLKMGSYTVMGISNERTKHREVLWTCKCDCGHEKLIKGSNLRKGIDLSCPICNQKTSLLKQINLARKKIEMIGLKVGRWTILDFGEYRKSPSNGREYTYWDCLCDCGTRKFVEQNSLLQRKSISCGCLRVEAIRSIVTYDDLSGKIFHNLTVLKRVEDQFYPCGGRSQMYLCQCKCGNQSIVARSMLISEATRSCGCLSNSHMEQTVKSWLEKNGIEYKKNANFPDLVGIKNGLLSYDFKCEWHDDTILIECQGEQHYRPVPHFGGESVFEKQQKHDQLKAEYAAKHHMKLVEAIYTMSSQEIEFYLSSIFFDEEK